MTAAKSDGRGKLRFPLEDPLTSLPATAQRILKAATRLLAERGFEAVTLENVAAEAGVNKASIRYNFGNKAGMLMAVVDALIHDECLRIVADTENVPEEERLHVAMLGIRRMITEADSFRGFFDILPHAFRDPELRERMFSLYVWWYQQNLRWLGLGGNKDVMDSDMLMGLAELIAAIPDGLSVQAGLNPDGFDLSRPLATLEFLLRNSMEQLVAIAEREAGQDAPATG
ncbi:MAG TPA: TetR/AcrR family transcriptional regulator [Thermoleophilia bacterium]|nr:TetR/AcrR family transcriptional regulator [Thermoleophilia bacterium]